MGDYRTYDHTVGIRAVTSIDGMTSDFARIDWEVFTKDFKSYRKRSRPRQSRSL